MSKVEMCYIAGPMRGYPNFNYPAFDAAARYMETEFGMHVQNPVQIERDSPTDHITDEKEKQKIFVERDVNALLICTHILMLPGWEKSVGAKAEWHIAKWLQLVVLYLHPDGRISETTNEKHS